MPRELYHEERGEAAPLTNTPLARSTALDKGEAAMAEKRKFRFGAQVYKAPTAAAWLDKARKIADLGYSSLLMPDHFHDTLGPLVALTAAALAAPALRIGTLVLDND